MPTGDGTNQCKPQPDAPISFAAARQAEEGLEDARLEGVWHTRTTIANLHLPPHPTRLAIAGPDAADDRFG